MADFKTALYPVVAIAALIVVACQPAALNTKALSVVQATPREAAAPDIAKQAVTVFRDGQADRVAGASNASPQPALQ